tara:strand:+ start:145 stop:399 length:255 start_codon:yes stop_codon:yes gene_type:complete
VKEGLSIKEKIMKTKTSKSSVDLHKQIELQYKNWTIKKPNSFAKQWEVYDQDNVQHRTLFRDIRTIDEAVEYIDEETSDIISFK